MDETVSTIRHTLVLHRLEPGRNVARFYAQTTLSKRREKDLRSC